VSLDLGVGVVGATAAATTATARIEESTTTADAKCTGQPYPDPRPSLEEEHESGIEGEELQGQFVVWDLKPPLTNEWGKEIRRDDHHSEDRERDADPTPEREPTSTFR
jgi:hypothetical protein